MNLGTPRRIVADAALLVVFVSCGLAFGELKTMVNVLSESRADMVLRLSESESRERAASTFMATKADVYRVEAQVAELRTLLLQNRRP